MTTLRAQLDAPAPGFAQPGARLWYAPDLGLEPVHRALDLTVDVSARTVRGAVAVTVLARTPGARSLTLDGADLDEVSAVSADEHALSWRYDGTRLVVTWEEAPGLGERRTVSVRWSVREPLSGMVFGPDWFATDHETERARYWWPCVDHPSVRTTLAISVRTAARWTVLANGAEQGREEHGDGTATTRWRLDQRCPSYLTCVAGGAWASADLGVHQGVPVKLFAPAPSTEADLRRSFGETGAMLDWMVQKLGPYPFPKYFQLAAPGVGGAMENISLVTWDEAWVVDELERAEFGWLVDLINVHEMGHSWFGDSVVCRDFAHSWLKESWATYIESCWLEDVQGVEAMQEQLDLELAQYVSETRDRYTRPIATRRFDSSWDLFDHHLYPGGAVRLHMLRRELGDAVWWPAVQDYLARFSGEVVETDDFRRVLEQHSGRSLAAWFDQWIKSPGHPKLKATWSHAGHGTLVIEQTQVDERIGLFRLPLTVAVERDGVWTRHELVLEHAREVLRVDGAAPGAVVIDPDGDAVFELDWDPGRDLLIRALEVAGVPGRIQAAAALAARGRAPDVEAIAQAWAREPRWGVKRAFARALGSAGRLAAARVLCELLQSERDDRVVVYVARALSGYRSPEVAQALETFLAGEPPRWAAAAALVALGGQRGEAHLPTLERWAEAPGWGWERRAAWTALGATRSARGLAALLERSAPDHAPSQVRRVLPMALADAVRWAPDQERERLVERLADLVEDPMIQVRLGVAAALVALARPSAVDALARLEKNVPVQFVGGLQRAAATLRKTAAQGVEVERLRDAVRKLSDRVDALEAGS